MKRMVNNGDLIDVEPDGTITAGGKAINAVEANPKGEATQTLEKIKIGGVAYNVGGGSENDKEITFILPYPRTSNYHSKYVTIDDENVWNKLSNYYYETVKIYYNDGYPLGIFSVIDYYNSRGSFNKGYRTIVPKVRGNDSSDWYGRKTDYYYALKLDLKSSDGVNKVGYYELDDFYTYSLDKSKFDALYKLADKPTQDGNYILKATVSGGAVTYTWVAQ